MSTDEYADFDELLKNYEPAPLPPPGEYDNLLARDGTEHHPYVFGLKAIQTFHSRFHVTVKTVPEYGPEFLGYMAGTMRFRNRQGFDNVIMVTGDERSGKSVLAQTLAKEILGHPIALDKITFKLSDFNKAIADAPMGDVIIMDEAGVDLFAPEWWDEFQTILVKKLFVIGVKRLTLIMVIPHQKDLNKKIRSRRVKYWFNVYHQRGTLERGFCTVREACSNEWDQDVYWDTIACCRFNNLSGPEWDEYSAKKMAFVEELNSGEYGNRTSKRSDRSFLIYLLATKGKMSQEAIAKEMGLSQSAISQILSNYKKQLPTKV